MGQQSSIPRNSAQSARSYRTLRNQQSYNKRIEHQGLIKLRPVPFKNCIEIQTDQQTLFLQNIEITLKDLLQTRLYTNKLFPKQDIEKLIENVTYTLAFLHQNGIPYKDVSSENIFYDDGNFKLLPNELIAESKYQKFLSYRTKKCPSTNGSTQTTEAELQFVSLSPQMIIAYRCKEPQINDLQIIDKSNVFYLGTLLLEVTTLLPAHECYDIESCDILDEVITQRIQLVKQYYSQEIASIIANFLDYDYVERMGLKDASIFVNRELNRDLMMNSKISRELSNKKSKRPMFTSSQTNYQEPVCSDPTIEDHESLAHSQIKSQNKSVSMTKSRLQNCDAAESRITRNPNSGTNEKRKNKTNKVYMNGSVQEPEQESVSFMKEQRNKVYMNQGLRQQESKRQFNPESQTTPQRSTTPLKQIQNSNNSTQNLNNARPQVGKVLNMTVKQKFVPSTPSYTPKSNAYQIHNEDDQQNRYPQNNEYSQQRNMKRKNSTDYLGYRATQNPNLTTKTPKQQKFVQNKYQQEASYEQKTNQNNYTYHQNSQQDFAYNNYPSKRNPEQKYNQRDTLNEDSESRGYFNHSKAVNSKPNSNTQFKDHDNSLSRIKSEIQRSRKLIEQFKRGQNSQY